MSAGTLIAISLAFLAGALLGWVQFRGLWETVLRLPARAHPGIWFAASLIARFAIVLAGFIMLARLGGLAALLAGLGGLLVVRTVLVSRLQLESRATRSAGSS